MRRLHLGLLALLLLLHVPPTAQAQGLGPEQLHVTMGDQAGTLVVHWAVLAQPYTALDPPTVTWHNGSAAAQLVGTIKPGGISARATGYETFVYAAKIGPFPPDSDITYRVGSAQRGMSAPRTVHTPPGPDQAIRFVAYGDIGLDSTAADGTRMAGRASHPAHDVRDLTIAQRPDLFLVAGDLPYNNAREGWDAFMRFSEPLQATVPTMPVLGNHEWEDALGYAQFLNTYVLPGDEHNYVFRAGPVTFIGVNTDTICNKHSRGGTGTAPRPCDPNTGESLNTALIDWLDDALGQAQQDESPWTVVYHHHPPYSWGNHGSDWALQTYVAPLYERHGVDLVLTAHDHMYSRTHPVLAGDAAANGTVYAKGTAPIYVVAGGGGRSLYDLRSGPWPAWLAHAEKVHHLARVDATSTALDFVALRSDGSEMDRFRIEAVVDENEKPADSPSVTPLLALAIVLWRLGKSRAS